MNASVSRHTILRSARSPDANRADRWAAQGVTIVRVILFLALLGLVILAVW